MRSRTAVLVTLLSLGTLSPARSLAFAQPDSRSATKKTALTSHSSGSFFGVMGQIARPGVYELPTAHPRLAEIIDRAGGLTSDASRIIRVVREGRIAFQTFYTPGLTLTLLPGDLLLIDGSRSDYRRGTGDVRPAGRIGPRATRSDAADKSQIEVAFVGLVGRPVVLRLRTRDATIGRVVQLLKQPATVIKTMRLISPARSRLQNRTGLLTHQTPLLSGSVIVFSRVHLDATRIPPLPKPIRRTDQSAVPPGIRGTTQNDPNVRHATRQGLSADQSAVILATGKRSIKAADPTGKPAMAPVIEDRPNGPVLFPGHHVSENPSTRHSAVTLSGRNVPHRLSQLAPPKSVYIPSDKPIQSESNAALIAVNGSAPLIPAVGVPADGGSSGATAAAQPDQSTAGLVLLFVLGCGLLAVGLAAMFLISMARTAVKTATTERTRIGNDEALEALIHNTIAIQEEEIELPTQLTLHGHPTGLRKLRIDAGRAPLRGPHFAVTAEETTADKTTVVTGSTPSLVGLRVDPPQSVTGEETAGRRREPPGPPKRRPVQRDVLDRVLSSVNKVTDG